MLPIILAVAWVALAIAAMVGERGSCRTGGGWRSGHTLYRGTQGTGFSAALDLSHVNPDNFIQSCCKRGILSFNNRLHEPTVLFYKTANI